MEDLYSLVQELSEKSYKGLKKFLLEYGQRRHKDSRLVQFLEILKAAPVCPNTQDIVIKMGIGPGNAQARVIRSRLKKRLLEFVSNDLSVSSEKHEDYIKAELRVRKNFTRIILLLRTRGSSELVSELIEQVIRESWEYEFYPVLKEVLTYKRQINGLCNSPAEFVQIKKEAVKAEKGDNATILATDYYYQLIMWESFYGKNSEKKKNRFLRNVITELNDLIQSTGSKTVAYYCKILELSYFSNNNNFSAALEVTNELLELVLNNKAIRRNSRISSAYMQQAKQNVYLNQFDTALELAMQQLKKYRVGSLNHIVNTELLFYTYFYKGEIARAKNVAVSTHGIISKNSAFRKDQFRFYEACARFSLGDFHGSLRALRENLSINKDRSGWGVGFRILRVMALIELDKPDQASAEIESIRKHLARYGDEELNKREKIILNTLQRLERKSFDFSALGAREERNLQQLGSQEKGVAWEYFTPEIIRFDDWMYEKIRQVEVPAKREKVLVLRSGKTE